MTNKNINTFHNDGKYIAASQRNGSGASSKTGVLSGFETEVLYLIHLQTAISTLKGTLYNP
jgi:hypothetical protein